MANSIAQEKLQSTDCVDTTSTKPTLAQLIQKNQAKPLAKQNLKWSNIFFDVVNEVGQKSYYPGLHKGHGLPFLKALGIKKEEVSHAGVRPGQMHVSRNKDINAIERFKGVKNLFKIDTKNKEAKLFFKIRKLDQLRAKAENVPKKVKILSSRMFVYKKQLEHWITKYGKIINITEAEQTFSNEELEDPSIKDFFKNSKSDDVIVEYIPNPRLNLPNILPVEGKN